MSVRPPQSLRRSNEDAPLGPLEAELLAEKAAGLGRSGGKVEAALGALAAAAEPDRPRLLAEAVETVYYYLIQRELCGLRDHQAAIAHYAIPPEVLARLGAH